MINTSARPIERHRIERIGGDRIWDSALTAALNMAALLRTTNSASASHAHLLRQDRPVPDERPHASSGLPRTFGSSVAIATITIIIAIVIRPNTPPTPVSRSI